MQVKVPKWWQQYLLEDCIANHDGIARYRALDAALDREVIIEMVMDEGGFSPVEKENYLEVIRRVAAVIDPALGVVYSCGKYDGGVYSVQQFLPEGFASGDNSPRAWSEVREWLLKVLTALQRTSEQSILHGRINLSSFRLSESQTLRLTGFGPGMALAQHAAFDSYTSPERLGGASVTLQGDIYSLGKVVWHCLAGRLPEEGGVLGGDVPAEISQLLRKMISTMPQERPASYEEIRKVVESAKEGGGSQPRKLSVGGGRLDEQKRGGVHLVGVGGAARSGGRDVPSVAPAQASGGNTVLNILLVVALIILIAVLSVLLLTYGKKSKPEAPKMAPTAVVEAAGKGKTPSNSPEAANLAEADGKSSADNAQASDEFDDSGDRDDDDDDKADVTELKPAKEISQEEMAKKTWRPLPDDLRKKRPHPKNPVVMRSRKVREYIAALPEEYRESVEYQAKLLNAVPSVVMFYAPKIQYDRGQKTTLLLRKGNRQLRAKIVMANDKGMMVKSLDNSQKDVPERITVEDLARRTVMDMMDYYCEFSRKRLDKSDKDYNVQMRALVKHYVVLMLLADWYDDQKAARRYADYCLELHPNTETFLAKYGYGRK
ncbi:MAG: hypothetical protein J5833_01385 [Victivallales bacterium]|nr:hypothetical protein [Victivallales bacterium]